MGLLSTVFNMFRQPHSAAYIVECGGGGTQECDELMLYWTGRPMPMTAIKELMTPHASGVVPQDYEETTS